MPAVLATSPSLRNSFGSSVPPTPSSSGFPKDDLTVAEIKGKAKDAIHNVRGASAISLLRSARDQAIQGLTMEKDGDLRGALVSLLKSALLMQLVISHQEFKQEREGKKGVVWREFSEFQESYGDSVLSHAKAVEAKLLELEKSRINDEPTRKVGGSIADRMKSLQDAGLSVQASKRFSRDLSIQPINGISRTSSSQPGGSITSPRIAQSTSPSMASRPTVSSSSVHSFVSPSSLGPPSPSSSTSSPHFESLSDFNQTFPPIDELEERTGDAVNSSGLAMDSTFPDLPSVPRNHPSDDFVPSPSVIHRFPSIPLDLDPSPRPASTPIPPTTSLQSRPPSPQPGRSQFSPVIPPKPAKLSTGASSSNGSISPSQRTPMNTGDSRLHERGPDLPVTNSVFPKTLHEYLESGLEVLLLDIRNRDDFVKGHIKFRAVVCMEPHVLLRNEMTGEKLEDALSVAPQSESLLFRNRDKFDLVVMYDEDSQTFGPSIAPMSVAVRIIYENAFRRMLRHPPVILVGGLKAWRTLYPTEIALEDVVTNGTTPTPNGIVDSSPTTQHRSSPFGMGQIPEDLSLTADGNGPSSSDNVRRLLRKPTLTRPPSMSSMTFNVRGLHDNSPSYLNGHSTVQSPAFTPINYPQFPRSTSTSSFGSSFSATPNAAAIVSPPPQASINPSTLRRRSDYIDQSEQAFINRPSIDYPDLSVQHVVKPPPAAAAPALERQDNRPRIPSHGHRSSISSLVEGPRPPTINSDYPVKYWPDMQIATKGLKNLGNTCYMNSTIQCLNATVPFARFFTDGRWKSAVNMVNPLGSKGQITLAFSSMLHELWHEELPYLIPTTFRKSICIYAKQFAGSEQHDSQEFLSFLLDGLHEDLNRILQKPPLEMNPEREAELEVLPQQIASQKEWDLYRMRNDSIVVDYFQGQFRNRMTCLTCNKTSTTYNTFMYLSLPIPAGRASKATLQQCLDSFVKEEVMEKADAWNCPNCKTLRKATKLLSLSRLPPILLIHLKRFTTKGHFTDKLETFVDFPLSGLDLTNYMPAPLPPGFERKLSAPISLDDPRSQVPPYKYDLYGVTNHFGSLSSGHYTAFVKSQGGWLYCDDSRITTAESREVVGKPAYVLYYKRVKW